MTNKTIRQIRNLSTAIAVMIFVIAFLAGTLHTEARAGRVLPRTTATEAAAMVNALTQPSAHEAEITVILTASSYDILEELNYVRACYGYGALRFSESLTDCAEVRSYEISRYFSHTRPDGEDWYTVDDDIMYGENLLRTQIRREAEDIVAMWMASPSHKDLILDDDYTCVGIARYHEGETDYWVLEFGYR